MEITCHDLPVPRGMVGGLAADPARGCLWVGLAGDGRMLWRYDVQTGRFHQEPLGDLSSGYSYIHRSIVVDGERLFVGLTWILGVKPDGVRPNPLTPTLFAKLLGFLRWTGFLIARSRVLEREDDGRWKVVRNGPFMSIDLASHQERLYRLSPKGVVEVSYSGEGVIVPSRGGFVHALEIGPAGEVLVSDSTGEVSLQTDKVRHILGNLKDIGTGLTHDPKRATPGIDGITCVGDRYLIGASRNKARPFIVDIEQMSWRLLSGLAHAPRASAVVAASATSAFIASGVGRVGLYRIHADRGDATAIESLGEIESDGTRCHHLHDLVVWPDGRIFGGEFFPLDVPEPPWPDRPCKLWEIRP